MFFATSSTPPNGVIRIFAIFFLLLFPLRFINGFESFLLLFIFFISDCLVITLSLAFFLATTFVFLLLSIFLLFRCLA